MARTPLVVWCIALAPSAAVYLWLSVPKDSVSTAHSGVLAGTLLLSLAGALAAAFSGAYAQRAALEGRAPALLRLQRVYDWAFYVAIGTLIGLAVLLGVLVISALNPIVSGLVASVAGGATADGGRPWFAIVIGPALFWLVYHLIYARLCLALPDTIARNRPQLTPAWEAGGARFWSLAAVLLLTTGVATAALSAANWLVGRIPADALPGGASLAAGLLSVAGGALTVVLNAVVLARVHRALLQARIDEEMHGGDEADAILARAAGAAGAA